MLKFLLAERTQKTLLSLWLLTGLLMCLFGCAFCLYLGLYQLTIPPLALDLPIHLNYPVMNGSVGLGSLDTLQQYQIELLLNFPTLPHHDNFMIQLDLNGFSVSRPVLLPYHSHLYLILSTLVRFPLLLTGLQTESESLLVPMIESVSLESVKTIGVTLNAPISLYSMQLRVRTLYQGLAWFMTHWYLTSTLFFTTLIALLLVLLISSLYHLFFSLLPAIPEADSPRSSLHTDSPRSHED